MPLRCSAPRSVGSRRATTAHPHFRNHIAAAMTGAGHCRLNGRDHEKPRRWYRDARYRDGAERGRGGSGRHRSAVRSESEFAALVEPHRRELRVHCYRMLGSLDEAEDMVQETFVKAWRSRAGFEGRSTLRAWLYRIATNACLDEIKGRRRRVTGFSGGEPGRRPSFDDVPWLQPIPDALLELSAPSEDEPEAAVVAKETIEQAFLVAVQHLPPRPRAVLMRDVLGWSASETAESPREHGRGDEQRAAARPGKIAGPRAGRSSGVAGHAAERRGTPVTAALHRRPRPSRCRRSDRTARRRRVVLDADGCRPGGSGTGAVRWASRSCGVLPQLLGAENPGEWRLLPTRANGQPAAANYLRRHGDDTYRAITSTCSRSKTVPWSRSRRSTPRCSRRSGFRRPCDARIRLCATAVAAHPTVLLRLRAVGHRPARGRNAPGRAGRVAGHADRGRAG